MRIEHNKLNKRIGIFSAETFTIQVAYFVEILLIQSQVVSSNHFGSRIKRSYLRMYGKLVCRELLTTDFDYMLAEIVRSFVYCSWAIRVNHAAEHLCCVGF